MHVYKLHRVLSVRNYAILNYIVETWPCVHLFFESAVTYDCNVGAKYPARITPSGGAMGHLVTKRICSSWNTLSGESYIPFCVYHAHAVTQPTNLTVVGTRKIGTIQHYRNSVS